MVGPSVVKIGLGALLPLVLGLAACSSSDAGAKAGTAGTTGGGGSAGTTGGGGSGGSAQGGSGGAGGASWALTSPSFTSGGAMPAEDTCDGHEFASGGNPELDWTDGPAGTKSYALVLKDLSIIAKNDPTVLNRAFHWVIWDIPTTIAHKIPTGMGDMEFPPEVAGARQWANRNQFGYFPPCPNNDPTADPATHVTDNYSLSLYAIDKEILDYPAPDPAVTNYTRTIHDTIESVAIGKTELLFTSNAASTAAPPALDPTTIKYPSARP
jgi:hypothetical protein